MQPYDDNEWMGVKPLALAVVGNKHYKFAARNITGGSVIDAGCGFGYLKDYLPESVIYSGIDCTQWIAEAAKARIGAELVVEADIMDHEAIADHVVAFGILETADDLAAMAAKLKSLANVSVIFSFCESGNSSLFATYSREEITAAFGSVQFFDNDTSTLAVWSA